jgi:hypothetical protein
VADDWAGDQVWKQQHEQGERPERIDRRVIAQAVDEIGNELKRKEADADRKQDMARGSSTPIRA